jgi:hypothetical protein
MQRCKVAFSTCKPYKIHNITYFIDRQIRICFAQKLLQIIGIKHLAFGRTWNIISGKILPALSF